jgi:Arylsulfotransferase (ASST)
VPVRSVADFCEEIVSRLPLVLGCVLAAALPAAPAAAAVVISPAAGTPDASAGTQISVLGVARSQIQSVTVTGSTSGAHPGALRAYAGSPGASFVLDKPLTAGEQVSAVVRIRGQRARRETFTVATPGVTPPVLNLPATQPAKLQQFVTQPQLTPPKISVLKAAPNAAGDIFLTPLPSPIVHPGSAVAVTINPVGPGGPLILDGRGNVVWFKQLARPDVAANLRIQHLGHRRVLTWWQGPVTAAAYGLGEGVIADSHYRTIATVHAGNGYQMDIHEFTVTPQHSALFTVYTPILVHLAGTPDGTLSPLLDAAVQEVDIDTGLVTWEWHAYGHIPLADSLATPANSAYYDAFHINSVQALAGGDVLISARDTSAIYDIDRASGKVAWTLGGKASSFHMGPGATFNFQHDAQLLPGDRVSLFDDGAGPPQKEPYSRGLVLKLDLKRHRATVAASFRRSNDTSAQSEGSLQSLPGGDMFAGFGATPFFSQFAADGHLVFDASLPQDDGSYRVYRFAWHGQPLTRPVAVADAAVPGTVSVYASWNGASGVARWQVVSAGKVVATQRWAGFETRIDVDAAVAGTGPLTVRALDARGHVLATSAAVTAT